MAKDPKTPPPKARSLPRRDLIILPLLVLATILAVLAPGEALVRAAYPDAEVDACAYNLSAPVLHGRAGCTSRMKTPEGPWVDVRYNECGYRTEQSCRTRPVGALRVAVIGSSTSAGFLVPYPQTMAARAAADLAGACGRPVEFQNLGMAGNTGDRILTSAREALALKPDALVLLVAPLDLESAAAPIAGPPAAAPAAQPSLRQRLVGTVTSAIADSRLLYMERYFILRNDDVYVPLYLNSSDKAGFMKAPLSPTWRARADAFETRFAAAAEMAKAQGVPMVLVFAPQRAQMAIASQGGYPDAHPELLPNELATVAESHGAGFANPLAEIPRDLPSGEIFYAVNGHLNGAGHAYVAKSLEKTLLRQAPAFAACKRP